MSMWDIVGEATGHGGYKQPTARQKRLRKYTHWPNPFGKMEDITVLACNPVPYVRAKMWGQAAGFWWFSNFVPSPTELFRNWLTGRYRCGVRFDYPSDAGARKQGRFKGPLDLIWTDGKASLVAAETLRPVLTGLWYLWATGTAWDALQQFSTVQAAIEACDDGIEEVILAHGEADFYYDGNSGAPTSYQEIHDPFHRYDSPNSFFHHDAGPLSTYAFGDITAVSQTVDYWRIQVGPDDMTSTIAEGGQINPGEVVNWSVEGGEAYFRDSAIGISCDIVQHGTGLAPTKVHVKRWLSSTRPYQNENEPRPWPIVSPGCFAPNQPPFLKPVDFS